MKDDDTWKDFQAKLRKSGVLSAYAAQELLAQDFVRQEQEEQQLQKQQGNHKGKRTENANHNRRPLSSVRRNSSIEDVSRTTITENVSSTSFCQDSRKDDQKLPPSKLRTMMRQSFPLTFFKRPEKSDSSSTTTTTPKEKIRRQEKFETHILQTSGIQDPSEFYPPLSYMPKRRSSFCLGSRELSNSSKPLLEILDAIPNNNPKSWNTVLFMNQKDEGDHTIQLSASISNTNNKEDDDTTENVTTTTTTEATTSTKQKSSQDSDPSLVVDFPMRRRLSLPSTKNGKQHPRKSFHVLAPTVVSNNRPSTTDGYNHQYGSKDTTITMTTTTTTTTNCPNKPIAHVELCSVRNLRNFPQVSSESVDERRIYYLDDSFLFDDSSTRNYDYFN
jgi:hypothetical protein